MRCSFNPSLKRLQKYMNIIREVARAIDNQLSKHIGDFEIVYLYHQIKDDLNKDNEIKDFKRRLNSHYVKNRSIDYCCELIKYYKSL